MTVWEQIWDVAARLLKQPTQRELPTTAVMQRALDEWQADIYDPPISKAGRTGARIAWDDKCRDEITSYIRDGLGWTWEPPYRGDGDFEWCGAFAAWCWRDIKPELRKTYFASTYRLDRYARYQSVGGEKNKGSGRLIMELDENSRTLAWDPRPGDILTIGPPGSGYGKHICLVESFEHGLFRTIEGNGTGWGPDDKKRQGVVRAIRELGSPTKGWHARRLIRPSVEDLG